MLHRRVDMKMKTYLCPLSPLFPFFSLRTYMALCRRRLVIRLQSF